MLKQLYCVGFSVLTCGHLISLTQSP